MPSMKVFTAGVSCRPSSFSALLLSIFSLASYCCSGTSGMANCGKRSCKDKWTG